jgi:GNAT superfamily N-acetyltransferase
MPIDVAEAIHANMLYADRRVSALGPAGVAERLGPWLAIDPGVDFPLFNMAIAAEPVSPARAKDAVRSAQAWFEQRRLGRYRLVARAGVDAPLVARARTLGFEVTDETPCMALVGPTLVSGAAEGLEVRSVRDEADLALYCTRFSSADPEWAAIIAGIGRTAMALPGFTLLLGLCEGAPVATSMAVVSGETVGVYNVEVDPRYRRRGFGAAMSQAAVAVGAESGCSLAGLQSSEMGLRMYEALGFRTVETYLSLERTG